MNQITVHPPADFGRCSGAA